MYALGIDLGTTFTAAAVWRNGHAEVASLGSRTSAVPSVVLLREDETVLTGEAASRRGVTEPQRVAREFKRRLGDTTPILLAGTPYSAEALMSRLLRWTLDEVSQREGGAPSGICICHPANWGPYKRDLLGQAVRLANIEAPVSYTTEPEAAAVFYAQQQRIEPGSLVAVYDLGGGTFDAAVLRKTATGFEILGQPEGIERLGGIDFDAAVFNHVRGALGGKLDELDPEDPAALAAVARLQEECVSAKEALSSDTDASIPVLLPNVSTEVRLTRAEFEAMVRPPLHSTIEAMRRALRSAGVTAEQLHSVLLVGGSSRMPLVAQLVGAELGRPVAVDAHPKHAISLGAAWLASGAQATPASSGSTQRPVGPLARPSLPDAAGRQPAAAPPPGSGGPATPAMPVASAAGAPASASGPATSATAAVPLAAAGGFAAGVAAAGVAAGDTAAGVAGRDAAAGHAGGAGTTRATAAIPALPDDGSSPLPPVPDSATRGRSRRRALLIGAATVVAALAVSGTAVAMSGGLGGDDPEKVPVAGASETTDPGGTGTPEPGASAAADQPDQPDQPSEAPDDETDPALPPDEECTSEIRSNDRWVCLTAARYEDDGALYIEYDAAWAGGSPSVSGGYHLHLYAGDGSQPPDEVMGTHAANRGSWMVEDASSPLRYYPGDEIYGLAEGNSKVCARIADSNHALVAATGGGYGTGNCLTIDRS